MARALLLSLAMIGAWSTAPLARAQSSNAEAKTIVVALLRQGRQRCRVTVHPRDNEITFTSGPQRSVPDLVACASAAAVLMREATGERMVLVDQDGLVGSQPIDPPTRPHWRCVARLMVPQAEIVCSLVS